MLTMMCQQRAIAGASTLASVVDSTPLLRCRCMRMASPVILCVSSLPWLLS